MISSVRLCWPTTWLSLTSACHVMLDFTPFMDVFVCLFFALFGISTKFASLAPFFPSVQSSCTETCRKRLSEEVTQHVQLKRFVTEDCRFVGTVTKKEGHDKTKWPKRATSVSLWYSSLCNCSITSCLVNSSNSELEVSPDGLKLPQTHKWATFPL